MSERQAGRAVSFAQRAGPGAVLRLAWCVPCTTLLRSLIRLKMSDIFLSKRIEYHLMFGTKNAFSEIIHTEIL